MAVVVGIISGLIIIIIIIIMYKHVNNKSRVFQQTNR